jgi:phage FluMu gp28-like protein
MGVASSLKLPDLHEGGQHEVFFDKYRFKILVCGRRWGKSLLAAVSLIECAVKGGIGWWVWPSFPMAMTGWGMLMGLLMPLVTAKVVDVQRQERKIVFPGGGSIQMKSSERANSLRGEGLDLVVVDEWAYIKQGRKVWEADLRPALADKMGKGMLITTPNGMDHVYEYYQHALKKDWEDFHPYHFPTWTNPFIPRSEIAAAKKNLPKDIFDQEYGALFLEDAASYFTKMDLVMKARPQLKAKKDHWYRAGLDISRYHDKTVLGIVDCSLTPNEVCFMDIQENQLFKTQRDRILDLCGRFDVEWLEVDATGLGYGLYEQLALAADFTVSGVKYTNQTKIDLFSSLRGEYEMLDLLIPNEEWLKTEHMMMKPEISPGSLTVRLNAREGFYDDGPNCMALTNRARKEMRVTVG